MSLTPELLALSDNWCLPFSLGLTENSCFPSLSFLWHLCHCSRFAHEFVSRLRLQSYNVFSRCASVREKFFNIYVNRLHKSLTISEIKICIIMLIYVNTIFHNYVAQQNSREIFYHQHKKEALLPDIREGNPLIFSLRSIRNLWNSDSNSQNSILVLDFIEPLEYRTTSMHNPL